MTEQDIKLLMCKLGLTPAKLWQLEQEALAAWNPDNPPLSQNRNADQWKAS